MSRAARVALLVAVIVFVDVLADFAFGAYATLSDVAWIDFRNASHVDSVFVGSSYAQRAFDPTVFDEALGTSSVNISTPGQMLGESHDAVRAAIDEKGVRRVILGLGVESLTVSVDPYASVPYLRARHANDPIGEASALAALALSPGVIGTKSSLNVLFPWIFTPVRSVQGVGANIAARLAQDNPASAAERVVPGWHYVGKGYGNYDQVLSEGDASTTVGTYGMPSVRQECLSELDELCATCEAAGVDLVVVSTPHPAFDVLSLGEAYPAVMRHVKEIAERHDAIYLDFNLAREDVLSLAREDFCDFEHLNDKGARTFSRAFAGVVARLEAGDDVSSGFFSYDEWGAWVSAHARS